MQVELLLYDTGFNPRPALLCINFQDVVEVFRHVDNNRIADSLTRQACPTATRQNRHFEIAGHFHRRKDIFVRAWDYDSYGLNFINAGIRAVHEP